MGWDWIVSPLWKLLGDGGSEAKKMAKMYAKVEQELGEQIEQLEADIKDVEDLCKQQYDIYMSGEGTAGEKILIDFENAVNVWHNRFNNLSTYIKNELLVVRMRRTTAAKLKSQYEEQARMEEMMANGEF